MDPDAGFNEKGEFTSCARGFTQAHVAGWLREMAKRIDAGTIIIEKVCFNLGAQSAENTWPNPKGITIYEDRKLSTDKTLYFTDDFNGK